MKTTESVSSAIIQARETGIRTNAADLPVPNFEQAMEIQSLVQEKLGPVSAFKVARRDIDPPLFAPIPERHTFQTGADVEIKDQMGIELEIGFELIAEPAENMMADPTAFFLPRIMLELVDTRLTGEDADPMLKLADMMSNGGLVVGPALEDWDGSDFTSIFAKLHCGDKQIVDGEVPAMGGSALSGLAALCAHVGDHCGSLRKGQIVITGSLSGMDYYSAGTIINGSLEGFGTIGCQLV